MTSRLSVEEVAAATGMTVRNIREHQTRGLLPPPEVEGRKGYYDERHVARLQLIQRLQGEGLNLQAIGWLLDRAPAEVTEEIGRFEQVLLAPWGEQAPLVCDRNELVARFGMSSDAALERAEGLDLVRRRPDGRWDVPSPGLLDAGRELVALGIPAAVAADVFKHLRTHAAALSTTFGDMFVENVWGPFDAAGRPPEEWKTLRETLERLRAVAIQALLAVFTTTMADEVAHRLSVLPGVEDA